jgi:hypothetical protein
MVFDIKLDLTRKARFVAGGHMTDAPTSITYSSVVGRDSVRIAFLLAALNDVDLLACDVSNAYLNALTKELLYIIAGPEFGSLAGRKVLIVRALYGLKSSGAAWRSLLASTMVEMGFTSCLADPDVWFRPATKPDGFQYYEYVLIYVDDILCLSHAPQAIIATIGKLYQLKEGSVGEPTRYLGAVVKKYFLDGDSKKARWAISSDEYIANAVKNVEAELESAGRRLVTKANTPMTVGYRPECDVSPVLDADQANYYQELIGVLRWACELGRLDILCPVALLSTYLAEPRVGHLDQVFHVFAYLKKHGRSTMVFDDTYPIFHESRFPKYEWSEFYRDAREAIPPNAPEPRGNSVRMSCFVDADHAGNLVTRRSHTGILIFCNRAPILWFSKRQNTVETSSFGSEFVALRIATELIEGLRYKLRMMGVPIDGPTNVFCDNQAVVINASIPESTLKKKHNSIAYHRCREAAAAGTIQVAKEPTATNIADAFTKLLPGTRLRELMEMVLF